MEAEKGHSKASRSARNFCKPAENVRSVRLSGSICSTIQRRQMRLYPGIVDTKELGCAGHHVNIKVLALGPLFVHELKYRVVRVRVLEDCAGDHEQGLSQMWRAALGDTAGFGVECTGLERRRVHAREGHQSALVGKPPHIADLRYELRSGDLASALHSHDHIEFRQHGGQTEHLPTQNVQRIIDGVQAVHGLGDEQLGAVVFGKCSHSVSGGGMELFGVRLREAIAGFGAPFAVSVRESGEGNARHAVLVPEAFHKIHPLEMPVGPLGLAVKKHIDAGEGLVQQGDQAVAEDHAGFLGAQVQAVLHG